MAKGECRIIFKKYVDILHQPDEVDVPSMSFFLYGKLSDAGTIVRCFWPLVVPQITTMGITIGFLLLIMLIGEVLEWEKCRTQWKMGYRILICGRESIETALIAEILWPASYNVHVKEHSWWVSLDDMSNKVIAKKLTWRERIYFAIKSQQCWPGCNNALEIFSSC